MAASADQLHGVLLLNKPAGITSHDAVDAVRRVVHQRSVGHAGTLDPLAEGLLLICLGKATKVARFLTGQHKVYEAELTLGRESSTYDAEGLDDSIPPKPVPALTEKDLRVLLDNFAGFISQTVPAYSAVHVGGHRLHELTRQGAEVDLPRRTVEIKRLDLVSFDDHTLKINVECSKGTYVRSLAHDIGQKLGCGAYLSHLLRTSVGKFGLSEAVTLDELHGSGREAVAARLLPIVRALDLGSIIVSEPFSSRVKHGQIPDSADILHTDGAFEEGDAILVKDTTGAVMALATAAVSASDYSNRTGKPVLKYDRVLV